MSQIVAGLETHFLQQRAFLLSLAKELGRKRDDRHGPAPEQQENRGDQMHCQNVINNQLADPPFSARKCSIPKH